MTAEDPTVPPESAGHQIDVGIAIAATVRAKSDDGSWIINDENVGWLTHGKELDPERGEVLSTESRGRRK